MQVQVTLPAGPLRWVAPTLYLAVLSAYMWREGIPVGRERLLIWIVLGLLALSTANVGGWARGVVLEWLPFALVLAVYDLLRGHADGLLFSTWYRPQLEADAFLFGGNVPTVWLQDRLWHGPDTIRWYDYVAWAVYVSYFVATYLVAGLLWFFARARSDGMSRASCSSPGWRSRRSRSSRPRPPGLRAGRASSTRRHA